MPFTGTFSFSFVGTSISPAGGAHSGIYLFLAVLTARSTVMTFEHKGSSKADYNTRKLCKEHRGT
jgi:hypothetical protein